MVDSLKAIDVLIIPTVAVAVAAPLISDFVSSGKEHLDEWYKNAYAFSPFTEIFNLTGQPAINIPVGIRGRWRSDRASVVGAFGDEETVLKLASEIEKS